MLGQKASFRRFLSELTRQSVTTEADSAAAVRAFCKVTSRSELNTNPQAAAHYRELIRLFNNWMNHKPLHQETAR